MVARSTLMPKVSYSFLRRVVAPRFLSLGMTLATAMRQLSS